MKAGETRGDSNDGKRKEHSRIDSVLTLKAVLGKKKQALVSVFKFNFFSNRCLSKENEVIGLGKH